jgi:hypothetical protein
MRRTDVTRSIRRPRRAALLLGGTATAIALLLSGCGTGQIAETAAMRPTVSGVNPQTADGFFKLRNLAVVYRDTKGYPAGTDAPLEVSIYNDSLKPVTVTVTASTSAQAVVLGGALAPVPQPSGSAASPSGSASATPSSSASGSPSAGATGSPTPSASATAQPSASIRIPAGEFVVLTPTSGSFLQLNGLKAALSPGQSVQVVFDFGGQQLTTTVPVAIPLTPAPTVTPVVGGEGHGG